MSLAVRARIERFPTQGVLTLAWIIIGLPTCLILRSSLLWIIVMSWYAIVVSHLSAHLAWRAQQAATQAATKEASA